MSSSRFLWDRAWSSRVLIFLAHGVLLVCAFLAAFLIRFDMDIPPRYQHIAWASVGWFVAAKACTFLFLGSVQRGWRFVSLSDLIFLGKLSAAATMVVLSIDYLFIWSYQLPRSVLLIDMGLTLMLFGGVQVLLRVWQEKSYARQLTVPGHMRGRRFAFIVGGLFGGGRIARDIELHPELHYEVIGFLEEDERVHGARIGGVPVLGGIDDFCQLTRLHRPDVLFVISSSVSGTRMRQLVDECRDKQIELKVIPAVNEILSGSFQVRFRDVCIDDLLRRDPVTLDAASITAMLDDEVVLVTGAGGSIGSEICRLVAHASVRKLVLVDSSENNLFRIEKELTDSHPQLPVAACLVDVTQRQLLDEVFDEHRPGLVFHAAAHKHVPMMEAHPRQAVTNNVFGTCSVAELANKYAAKRFVLISTDKAVNPTSVMGATKQMAERYVHTCMQDSPTRFVVVRFGNVLASAGSVVPIFQEQIRQGRPLTITDPRMERFFMTIAEASQLVLQAAAIGQGGEIFVLDMGQQIKIVDLAQDLIRLSGFSENEVPLQFVGCRPGEKLTEELYFSEEETLETKHPRIRAAYHRPLTKEEVDQQLQLLQDSLQLGNDQVVATLRQVVPEYSDGVGLAAG